MTPKLIRKRLIPFEETHLKDDKIIYIDKNIIVTEWSTLKPKKEFSHGKSLYLLDKGWKISKFMSSDNKLVYYYCDIIDVNYNENKNCYIFTDLLADVIIYADGFIKVVDLDEISFALDENLIDLSTVKKILTTLNSLLTVLYEKGLNFLAKDYLD